MPPSNFEKNKKNKPKGEDWDTGYSERKSKEDRYRPKNNDHGRGGTRKVAQPTAVHYPNQEKIEQLEDEMKAIPHSPETKEFNTETGLDQMRSLTDDVEQLAGQIEGYDKKSGPKEHAQTEQALDDLNAELESSIVSAEQAEPATKTLEDETHRSDTESSGEISDVSDEREISSKNSEGVERAELKLAFKTAEKKYYATIKADFADKNMLRKFFGGGRKNMSDEVQAAHDDFMAANKAYYAHAKESGLYQKLEDRINREKKSRLENSGINSGSEDGLTDTPAEFAPDSIASAVAGRHVLRPAEERLELQTMHLPEKVAKVKATALEYIKNNKKKAGAVAVGATIGIIALNPAALAAMGTGLIARYVGQKIYVGRKEEVKTDIANIAADALLDNGDDLDLLEREYFAATNAAHNARINTNVASAAAAIAAGSTYSSFGEEQLVQSAQDALGNSGASPEVSVVSKPNVPPLSEVPDFSGKNVDISDMSTSIENQTTMPTDEQLAAMHGEVVQRPEAIVPTETVDPAKTIESTEPVDSVGEGLPKNVEYRPQMPSFEGSLNESVVVDSAESPIEASAEQSAEVLVEKAESTYTIESGDTMSEVLSNHMNILVENGVPLPKGVGADELTHYMYQSFPEMTSASDITPRLSPEQWREIGVSSGDPNLIYPGEVIDMEALTDKLWGANYEASIEVPEVSDGGLNEAATDGAGGDTESVGLDTGEVSAEADVFAEDVAQGQDAASDAPSDEVASDVENIPVSAEAGVSYEATDFSSLLEKIGLAHNFDNDFTPNMWNHMNDLIDQMSFEMKEKYLTGLIIDGVEQDQYHWLEHNMPEASGRWAASADIDLLPDAMTPEQWQYVGVPSGSPKELAGATLDHSKLFEVLFNSEFEMPNPADSGETAGLQTTQSESIPDVITNEREAPWTSSEQLRTYREDVPDNYAWEKIDRGERWVNPENPTGDYFEFKDTAFLGSDFRYERMMDGELLEIEDVAQAPTESTETTPALSETAIEMSESYIQMLHTVEREDERLNDYLVQMITQGVDSGDIVLPEQLLVHGVDYSGNLLGYVEATLPDIATTTFGDEPNVLTPDIWQSVGVSSGDPTNLTPKDRIQVGRILEFIFTHEPQAY